MKPIEIFIAYAHNDLRYKDELKKFLRPLLHTGKARVWDDYDIESGQDWEAEIKIRLYGADVILLLVSPDSLASDYFYGREVAVSLERHAKGEAAVVPVILRPCHWTITPLAHIEAMPEKAKAVTSWASQDEAFTDIAHRLSELVEKLLGEQQARSRQEATRRDFTAAVQAADHLYGKSQWTEARDAYAAALKLYQNGFTPDRAALDARRADCDARQKQAQLEQRKADKAAQTRQAVEKKDADTRYADYRRAMDRAGDLFNKQNWAEALTAYREAERLRQPNWPTNFNDPSIAQRIAACEEMLGQPRGLAAPTRLPETQKRITTIMGCAISVLLLVIAILVVKAFWPKKQNPGLSGGPANPPETSTPAGSNTISQEAYLFASAEQAGTLPAWRRFLDQYPNSKRRQAAQIQVDSLQNVLVETLTTARAEEVLRDNRRGACKLVQKALAIDPENSSAVSLKNKLNCPD